jgi:hypothetical protein
MINNIVISDQNTTGVMLQYQDTLNVTTSGSIKILSDTNKSTAVDSDTVGDIINAGVISASTNSSDINNYASGILQHQTSNTITNANTGNIVTSSFKGVSVGIGRIGVGLHGTYVTSSSDFNATGTIINQGSVNVSSKDSLAIGIFQENGLISNSGSLDINSTNSVALGIVEFSGKVTNSGTIKVGGSNGASGILIKSNNNNDLDSPVFNSGIINVVSSINNIYGILQHIDGNITNSGSISVANVNSSINSSRNYF